MKKRHNKTNKHKHKHNHKQLRSRIHKTRKNLKLFTKPTKTSTNTHILVNNDYKQFGNMIPGLRKLMAK